MTIEPGPWAKLIRDDDRQAIAALPLVDHCLDVGAAGEAVVRAWAAPLAAAGRVLTEQDVARLVVLIALHDLGKANRGFQARIDPKVREYVGHTGVVAALLTHSKLRQTPAAVSMLAMLEDWGATEHFAGVMAHHGRPLVEFGEDVTSTDWTKHTRQWMPKADGDPAAAVLLLLEAVRERWPLAWEAGPALPDAPRFVALFAGLVTLADWLGSDEQRFPIDGPYGAARDALRAEQVAAAAQARGFLPLDTPPGDFEGALGFAPFAFQSAAARGDLGPVALIEAETGSGKTEAALWRWLELRRRGEVDGLFFALPTRSAAVQLHKRVNDILQTVWGAGELEAVLAVPGYLKAGATTGQALPGFAVRWDDGAAGDERWAAERANRFLAARVAVGTIDQALLGVLPVKHALFRAGVLTRSLLVVDEVHASDAYMTGLLERLLDHHVAAGGRALLLSATLGAAARGRLLGQPVPSLAEAVGVPYPALSGRDAPPVAAEGRSGSKPVRIEVAPIIDDTDSIAARAVEAARAGAAVLVVRNSVRGAIAVAQAVAAQGDDVAFKVAGVATLHHGRFAPVDRKRLDEAVTLAFGKGRAAGGRVLVGTQTLEQSLDIDADLLITDLAPIDVLLQRIGRLHRHARDNRGGFAQARAIVLRPAERDLAALLARKAALHGLGGGADRSPYPNLIQLEATLQRIEATPDIVIPRDNRRLVEEALHPEVLAAVAAAGSAAWAGHGHALSGGATAERQTAEQVALDFTQRFTAMRPFDREETVATRLGVRDLLIDLPQPLAGPFGGAIERMAIPGWLVSGRGGDAVETVDAQRFRLGDREFRYDQWGLQVV
ncbi:CRISPR-associated helicase Cas3' [Sphingomonas hankookensis]|uniref:CRISPR-associated helicase Cas3' n=1 Tax=Sphingomonas hankookensis TaxID=563996 RepID=UPI001F59CD5F|nr:CRISPR-associated helicase Cas3' [Sphingomonas hankookensis]